MTDHDHDLSDSHLDDEALSAALDGDATDEQSAHVAACHVCADRLESFRVVLRALRGTGGEPVDDAARDRTVAAVLAATDLERARARRRGRAAVSRRLAGIAAAVLVVLGIGAGTLVLGDDDRGTGDTALVADDGPAEESADRSGTTSPADSPAESGAAVAVAGDLGEHDDADGLAAAVRRSLAEAFAASGGADDFDAAPSSEALERAPAENEATRAAAPCAGGAPPDRRPVRYRATATVDGRAAVVYGFESATDPPALDLVAVAVDDCRELLTVQVTTGG